MNLTPRRSQPTPERGVTLVELCIALVVLAIGVLALAQTFPAGARKQTRDRLFTSASDYVQDQAEILSTKSWGDAEMNLGRHPSAGYDSLGRLLRYYDVSSMASPLDNLRKVTVRVQWNYMGARACSTTIYVRR